MQHTNRKIFHKTDFEENKILNMYKLVLKFIAYKLVDSIVPVWVPYMGQIEISNHILYLKPFNGMRIND